MSNICNKRRCSPDEVENPLPGFVILENTSGDIEKWEDTPKLPFPVPFLLQTYFLFQVWGLWWVTSQCFSLNFPKTVLICGTSGSLVSLIGEGIGEFIRLWLLVTFSEHNTIVLKGKCTVTLYVREYVVYWCKLEVSLSTVTLMIRKKLFSQSWYISPVWASLTWGC